MQGHPSHVTSVEAVLQPKCLSCGNSRVFHVTADARHYVWSARDPLPAGGKVLACGKCNSRHSLIMDYSD